MTSVTVQCDECGGLVEGTITYTDGFTAGFYLRGWAIPTGKDTQNEMFPKGKNVLCDFCMQSTPGYKKMYGDKVLPLGKAVIREPHEDEVVRTFGELLAFIKSGGSFYVEYPV